ncbi:MFS transporter [Streptomyces sp. LP11]|uniref:MFS transporter n=1 Tax=Streptomyces pyxinicus TaxID=2970331 RepID=A0ABT2B3R8_9ACTN|nr:MFS transporter [Streptomyces sp. LP11]MCS0603141.1 MFS transporter [Streptomyces sp. LP11]
MRARTREPGQPGDIPGGGNNWAPVAVAGVLSFLAMLDMNIVNVALADIADGLRVSAATAQWTVLAYQLPVIALLLPAARLLDGIGTRSAVLTATAGFAVCGALAAAAPWAGWLITARLAQGVFATVLFVLMPVLAIRSVRPELRGRAMSVPATLGPLGAVLGPAAGGLLLDHLGWRAVFLVKLPFCALAFLLMPRRGARDTPVRRERAAGRTLVDAALLAAGVATLLLALTLAARDPAWLALGAAAFLPLGRWSRGPGARPLVGVLREPGLARAHGAVLALATGFAAMHYVVALHLQRDDGVSATTTGLTLLAFPLGMGLAGPLGGRLADLAPPRLRVAGVPAWLRAAGVPARLRVARAATRLRAAGAPPRLRAADAAPPGARPVAVAGAALTAAGLLLLLPLGGDWSPADVAWRLALAGVGMGLNGGPTQALVMATAPPDRAATAGATVQLARGLGFALGPALATTARGLAGPADGTFAGLALAAGAACLAVPLLAGPAAKPNDCH